MQHSAQRPPAVPPAEAPATQQIRWPVSDLLRGRREAILEHDGQEYRLRITSKGKLILTK